MFDGSGVPPKSSSVQNTTPTGPPPTLVAAGKYALYLLPEEGSNPD